MTPEETKKNETCKTQVMSKIKVVAVIGTGVIGTNG